MKKIIIALAATAMAATGAATAEVRLATGAMDEITAGSALGGNQRFNLRFDADIHSNVRLTGNSAGAASTADAFGKFTATDAKAFTYTEAGVGSSSTAASVSAATNYQPRRPRKRWGN